MSDSFNSKAAIRERKRLLRVLGAISLALLGSVLLYGCSEDTFLGERDENVPPTITLTNGPVDGEETEYNVHFFWFGYDPDGVIDYYEYILVSGDPIGFDPADTTGIDKWTTTAITDIRLKAMADVFDTNVTIGYGTYARYAKTHTFFVRAVDNNGERSTAAHSSFTAWTLAPTVMITFPRNPRAGSGQVLNPVITFVWDAKDPIDGPWNTQDVDSVRYLLVYYTPYVVDELNKSPELYEDRWSNWIANDAPGDSGRSTVLGDDEILQIGKNYLFAIQAKDEVGAISSIFDMMTNVRKFLVMEPEGPLLWVQELHLGTMKFMGTDFAPYRYNLPAGFPINFKWSADAGAYGADMSSFRYGWDIADLTNPEEWDVTGSLHYRAAPEVKFYSGTHTFYIEAKDTYGAVTLARIEITIFPLSMRRDLLLVDDFNSTDFPQTIYAMPTETQHDDFWRRICSRVPGYDPSFDVYDTRAMNWKVPDIEYIWQYKNIIWVYSSEDRTVDGEGIIWIELCQFTPESYIGPNTELNVNYVPYYLEFGGHIWSCGKSDREGGLGGLLPSYSRQFPMNLKCEITGPRQGCDGDTSGVFSMPYRDYCVTVLDKVWGRWRLDILNSELRHLDYDALSYAYMDRNNPMTASFEELPEKLELWSKVVEPGKFFDPSVRGFSYVEIYNPNYWMGQTGASTQSCFHPMYRMRTMNSRSVVDRTVIAFWSTKHADVVAEAPGAVAAPNVHFGVPLWFFNRSQVDSIADVIFGEWQILGDQ